MEKILKTFYDLL